MRERGVHIARLFVRVCVRVCVLSPLCHVELARSPWPSLPSLVIWDCCRGLERRALILDVPRWKLKKRKEDEIRSSIFSSSQSWPKHAFQHQQQASKTWLVLQNMFSLNSWLGPAFKSWASFVEFWHPKLSTWQEIRSFSEHKWKKSEGIKGHYYLTKILFVCVFFPSWLSQPQTKPFMMQASHSNEGHCL